jgi:hypothetical protein
MYDYTDLYDLDDYDGHDTGDDCNRLLGRHTEAECRYFREEMACREAHHTALGVAEEYHALVAAVRRPALGAPRRKALPGLVPESKRLPAGKSEESIVSNSNEEDVKQ